MTCLFVVQVKSKLRGHSKRITGLAFSNVLNVLVSSGADAQVIFWTFKFDHIWKLHIFYLHIFLIFSILVVCLEHGWMGEAKEQIFADTIRSPIQHTRHSGSVPPRPNALSCCARNSDCNLWNYKARTSEAGKLPPPCLQFTLAM
jgi:WD40 repeat protein